VTDEFPNIPGYKIERRLGQGGMATVYLAIQESFGRHVALKIMSESLGEDDVWAKRFIKEAQIVAQLSHPNIVPVFDVGTYEGRFYISMECMKGGDLEGKMAKGLAIPDVLKIIVGVAAGLDFAGEKGFVHRDIKPDNVMFREDGSPVILDFGIVKQKGGDSDKMTKTGTIVGTTAYMSPEQAQGKELDERSDIYSLGCMMYELLVGRTPYQGDSAVAVLLKHVNEPPPQLPEFIGVLQPVLEKAMAKKVEDRYTRARDMIEHLQELEPQIKGVLAQQQAMFNAGSEDATGAMPAVGSDDATVATDALPAMAEPGETDLTSVLSSAKATIADFSEEARQKKARNTRRAFVAAAVLVVCALGYAGFYQFYLVPQELAAAERQRDEKITALLSEAQNLSKGLYYSNFEAMDKVVARYREVLQLDPDNATAKKVLENFGAKYIELANKAADKKDLDKAETYQGYAEQLAPRNPQLAQLRESVKSIRSESTQLALENQFKQQQIETLLNEAKADMADGKNFLPDGDNAYATLQQVIQLDANNAEAMELSSKLLEDLFDNASRQIASQQLRSAEGSLEILNRYYEDQAALASLQEEYKAARSDASKQAKLASLKKKKEQLLTQAERLQRERRTASNNDEIRDLYLKVLNIDSNNIDALEGMDDTSDYEAKWAKDAIQNREYRRAKQNIALVEKYTPDYSGLGALKNNLSQAERSAKKADEMLASADKLIASASDINAKREELQSAYQFIDGALQIDRSNPGIDSYMSALEAEYLAVLNQLLAAKKTDLADQYFADAENKPWPSDRITTLRLSHQSAGQRSKPKPKRVITGGF